jgi:TRAP-type C4-dicarboxylate transport system permease small subunit
MVALVAVQGWQVFARYVLNNSPAWTEPMAVLLLTTTMSLGAAASVHAKTHFAFLLGVQAARPWLRRILLSVTHLIAISIGLMLAYWGMILFLDGLDVPMAGVPLPQSANFLPLSVGGALIAIFAAQHLSQTVFDHRAGAQ